MKIIKLLSINLIVLLFLLLILEIIGRGYLSYREDINYFSRLKVRELTKDTPLGLTEYNSELGHIPREGFSEIISTPRKHWNDVEVSILTDGIRANDNSISYDKDILAIGDSFVFGDQVSNYHTWPSCLERELRRGVDNAGVFGYGGAQAVKRGQILANKNSYNRIILSIFTDDFYRDQYSFRYGFPVPSVIRIDNNEIGWDKTPKRNSPGTRYHPERKDDSLANLLLFMYENSSIARPVIEDLLGYDQDLTGIMRQEINKRAASIGEIAEFAFKEFSKINIKDKLVVIQYPSDYNSKDYSSIRNMITNSAKRHNIPLLDTFKLLKLSNSSDKLWFQDGHHTPYGNELICKAIAKEIIN